MGKRVYISQGQFEKMFKYMAKNHVTVNGMSIVKHVSGSTRLNNLGGCSSPSEYWEKNYDEPIQPQDRICTSCMKSRKEFVVGHIENIEQTKMWLYPVCKHCNDTYKLGKSEHLFYALKERMKEIKTH